jgi:hypothetical protein
MTSSIVLKNILDHESCELKQMIDAFMGEKMAEFQQTMKQNVDKIITERISEFYSPLEPNLEEVLFDKTSDKLNIKYAIDNYIIREERYFRGSSHNTEMLQKHLEKMEEVKELLNQKCFDITLSNSSGYIFKKYYFYFHHGTSSPVTYYCLSHNIPNHVLFTIKYISSHNHQPLLTHLQQCYNDHPQYFQPNCVEFETICQREHAEIKKQKEELEELTHQSNEIMEEAHRIIDENVEKKEYYESLDRRLQQIVLDEEKIREEKQKMLFVKERLLEMKAEIEKERQELEKEKQKFISQKNKSIDIDKCFEDLL